MIFKEYKLKELVSIKNGKDHKGINDGDIPIYGSGGIMRYGNESLYNEESVLLPRKGTLDNIQYVNTPFWTVDTIYYTEVNKKVVEPFYLYNYLRCLDLSNLDSGTGVPSMTFGAYYGIDIKLPPLSTQRSIAKILSDLDAKIELNNKINQELEAMAKTIYDYWFVQFDFPFDFETGKPCPNGKPYKSSGGKMVYNEELKRDVPEGWEVKSISNLLHLYTDKSEKINAKDIKGKGCYPVITQDNKSFISGYTNKSDPIVDFPLIVFGDHSCTIRYVDFPFFRGADGTQLMYFNNKLIVYIYLFLSSVIEQIPGYGKYERHFKYLKDFKVLIPDNMSLKIFNNKMEAIFTKPNKLMFENQHLSSLRDWLLPMLMNGQVSVGEE